MLYFLSLKRVATNAPRTLKTVLRDEKSHAVTGGIYHKIQIELTYNSNQIEGSKLTHDETRYIYETNTIGIENKQLNIDDIVPFIITDAVKMFYYRGLSEWNTEKKYLRDTCLTSQDAMKKYLDYLKIEYTE